MLKYIMQSKLDIFIMILFLFTMSITLGLSVTSVIDKKISNVAINIPPIKLPPQTIVVKIDSEKKDKIEYKINNSNKTDKSNENKIETFDNTTKNSIDNPNKNNIVEYDDSSNILISKPLGIVPEKKTTQFENNIKFKKCGKKKEDTRTKKKHNVITCNDEIKQNYQHEFYNSKYKPQIAKINGYKMVGFNYSDYNNNLSPYKINFSIVPRKRKKEQICRSIKCLPKGFNYVFDDSPAIKKDL